MRLPECAGGYLVLLPLLILPLLCAAGSRSGRWMCKKRLAFPDQLFSLQQDVVALGIFVLN